MSDVLEGIFGGAGTGASAGLSIGGPVGAGIGAVVGGIFGGISGAKSRNAMAAARKATVPEIDPTQQWYLNRLKFQEKQMRAGADPSSAFAATNARNVLGQTQANIVRSSGGNPTVGINGLLRSQAATNQAIQGIGAQAANNANNILFAEGALVDNMAERKRSLAEYNRALKYSEAVNRKQDLNNLFNTGLSLLPSLDINLGGRRDPSTGGGATGWGRRTSGGMGAWGVNTPRTMAIPSPSAGTPSAPALGTAPYKGYNEMMMGLLEPRTNDELPYTPQ